MSNVIMINGVKYAGINTNASEITYGNTTSGLSGTTVQTAIDALDAIVDGHTTSISTLNTNVTNLTTTVGTKQNSAWALSGNVTGSTYIALPASGTEYWIRVVANNDQGYNAAIFIPKMMLTTTTISFRFGYSNMNVTMYANTTSGFKLTECVLAGTDYLSNSSLWLYYR